MTTTETTTKEAIHWETGAGIVRCGAPMQSGNRPGWNMSTSSVSLRDVTCSKCRGGK